MAEKIACGCKADRIGEAGPLAYYRLSSRCGHHQRLTGVYRVFRHEWPPTADVVDREMLSRARR